MAAGGGCGGNGGRGGSNGGGAGGGQGVGGGTGVWRGPRIVNVASRAHYGGSVEVDVGKGEVKNTARHWWVGKGGGWRRLGVRSLGGGCALRLGFGEWVGFRAHTLRASDAKERAAAVGKGAVAGLPWHWGSVDVEAVREDGEVWCTHNTLQHGTCGTARRRTQVHLQNR